MSEQELINAAKAVTVAYNNKDWDGVRAAVTADFLYDEVGTQRKVEGTDQFIEVWQGGLRHSQTLMRPSRMPL